MLTKELLLHNEFSINYIANEILPNVGIQRAPLIKLCTDYRIPIRTIKEASNLKSSRTKFEETCRTKFGASNVLSRGTLPFKNRDNTVRKKYGVKNVFQLPDVKRRIRESTLEKYGVSHIAHLPNSHHTSGRKSKIHKEIESILIELGIIFQSEVGGKFKSYNKYLKREYSPIVDILLTEQRKVIEIYGDRWHANPKLYRETDMIKLFSGLVSSKEIREKDYHREEQIKEFGYSVLVLWESDIKNNKDLVRTKLNGYCKN